MADWGTPSAFDHRPSVVSGLMDLLRAFRGRTKNSCFSFIKVMLKKDFFQLFL